jgi:hypothetical protein
MKPCLAWRNLESIALKRDAKYLLRSIIAPSADIEPKTSIMPEMTKPLSRREIRNLVAYLMTLRKPVILHAVSIEPLASRTPSGGGLENVNDCPWPDGTRLATNVSLRAV